MDDRKSAHIMEQSMVKVPLITKVAYGCGDVSCNISFGVISTLLTLFYTDYVGVSAATIGLVMLISRIFDGVSDVIMGYVVSHTNSKWGQSRLMKKYGKRNIVLVGSIIAIAGQVLFMFNPYSFEIAVASCIIRGIGAGPLNACVFGMLNDVVEFGQQKSKLRQESYIFAAGSVGSKIAPGLTSALVTGLLTTSGYISSVVGGVQQPQEALDTIVGLLKFGPLVVWILVFVVTLLYQLDKKYPQIMKELAEREARGEM